LAGTYLIINDHSGEGLASILVPIGTIVSAFVYQQRKKKGEVED